MTEGVPGSDVGLWRCHCGHINVDGSTCELCRAAPPHLPEHRHPDVTPVLALWEQVHAGEDAWLAERLATLKAPADPLPAARIEVAWEAARTCPASDMRSQTLARLIGLNLLLQFAIIVLTALTTIDHRQAIELSLGSALMINGATVVWGALHG